MRENIRNIYTLMIYACGRFCWAVQAETVDGKMAHIGAKLRQVF